MNEDPYFYEQMKTNIIYKEKINQEITQNENQHVLLIRFLIYYFTFIKHNIIN